MAVLRWLMYCSGLVCLGALVMVAIAPGVSLQEGLTVAVPSGFLSAFLLVLLAGRGELRGPNGKFILGTLGVLALLGGGGFAAALEIPIADRRHEEQGYRANAEKIEQDLKTAPAAERLQMEAKLTEQRGYAEGRRRSLEEFRLVQYFAGGGGAVGLILLMVAVLLPKREALTEGETP